jgi:uncharacterized protein with NRDE domain
MCICFFWRSEGTGRVRLAIASNRDEYLNRPSESGSLRSYEQKTLFHGRDKLALGTWLAVADDGKYAILTNFRSTSSKIPRPLLAMCVLGACFAATAQSLRLWNWPSVWVLVAMLSIAVWHSAKPRSRGELPLLFVRGDSSIDHFARQVQAVRSAQHVLFLW